MTPEARDQVLSWLAPRLAEAPAPLAEAVRRAIEASSSAVDVFDWARMGPLERGDTPEWLAGVALRELDAVAAGRQTRGAALRLLAADALLTYAFEAAADPTAGGGAGRVDRLADAVGPAGALGVRIDHALGRGAS